MASSRTRNTILNIMVAVLSLLLTLISCEAILRVLQQVSVLPVYNSKTLDKGNTANKHVNARLVRSANPVLFMEFDRNDPNINNAGFRGADFSLEKKQGTVRIAILGDSVAYGYSVKIEQTFSHRLAAQLLASQQPVEVLNFAVSGYSTVAELELYKTVVRNYRPDIVLLAYVLNDPLPAAFVVKSVGSARKEVNRFKTIARYSQLAAWALIRWQSLQKPFNTLNNYEQMYEGDSWTSTLAALDGLQKAVADDKAILAIAVFPLLVDFKNYPMWKLHEKIKQALTDRNIPHIDLLDAFSTVDAMSLRPHPSDDTHPNAEGHAIASEQIGKLLMGLPPLNGP